MLTHIVLVKCKPGTPEAELERLLEGLRGLPPKIAEIRGYEVGRDMLHLPRSFDAALIGRFDDLDALKRYQAHPEHVPLADGLRAIAEQMVAVDWES